MSDILHDATIEQLQDRSWLEDAIFRLGVYPAEEIPPGWWTVGSGYGICQFPIQFAPYLIELSKLKIKSYVEIGVWMGGTFRATVEYLSRFGLERALATDIEVKPSVREFCDSREDCEWFEGPSTSPEVAAKLRAFKPDLLLVDGDHSEEGARADWELARSVAKHVSIHDVVGSGFPGVIKVWEEIDLPNKLEFVDQLPETEACPQNGMGLVTVRARGWKAHLEDDKSATEITVDVGR